jgi:hypothetical protein
MPISFHWDDTDQTVAVVRVEGYWTWVELEAVYAGFRDESAAGAQPRYVITDLSATTTVPPNILAHGVKAFKQLPEKVALDIVVTTNTYFTGLANMLLGANGGLKQKVRIVSTMDEAYSIIERERQLI